MTWKSKKLVAAVVAALVVGTGTGTAAAAGHARAGLLKAAAQYLGLSRGALAKDLRSGQTLAQVAQAQGKSVAGLQAALLASVKARLDKAVAAGRITAAQEQQRLAAAQTRIAQLVGRPLKVGKGKAAKAVARGVLLRAAATYLGLQPQALRQQLRSGSSLAQIATAQGKSVSGLQAAMLAAVKAKLDKQVAAGRLTAAQEQRLLARAAKRIERLVNRSGS